MVSKCSVFMFIVVTIHLMSVNGERHKRKEENPLCLPADVLCVKDVLSTISKAAKDIREMANKIKVKMWKKEVNSARLQMNINRIQNRIMPSAGFPSSKYHDRFNETNNIDKNDLVRLFVDEHDAVSYLYVSIKNLLPESFFDHEFDALFHEILRNLQHNMLCNYRNILHVYSDKWLPVYPKHGIKVLKTRKREITSLDYRSYAIVILKLARQWMEKIEYVDSNLENKLI